MILIVHATALLCLFMEFDVFTLIPFLHLPHLIALSYSPLKRKFSVFSLRSMVQFYYTFQFLTQSPFRNKHKSKPRDLKNRLANQIDGGTPQEVAHFGDWL